MNIANNNSTIYKNTFFLYLLTFSNYFISLLLFPYISRTLDVEGFGLIGFSIAYVLIFQVIVEFGFMISTTATISKHRSNSEKLSEIVSTTMYAKIILAIISIILYILSVFFVQMVRDHILIVSLFLVNSLLSAMLPDFFFRGIEKMKTITVRTITIRVISLLLIVAFVRDESQITLIPVALIIGNLFALFITINMIIRAGVKLKLVQVKNAIDSIKEGSMFFISRLAVSVNQSMGTFIIGLKFSPLSLETGIFSGATRISSASEMLLAPVSDSLYPHMVNKKDYKFFKKVILMGGIVWFFGCLFAFVFATDICRIILGSDYAAAGDLLRVLLFGNFMAFFSNMFGYNALSPIGKSNHANIALLVSAGFSVFAYGVLWLTSSINLTSVCTVTALANVVVFGYRVLVFWNNIHLTKQQ